MLNDVKIIAITTDPYNHIHGYALTFMKIFDYIQKSNKELKIVLMSNDGACSKRINNQSFEKIKLNPNSHLGIKTMLLACSFVKRSWAYDKNTILVANAEIPELLAALILSIKFKKVYCFVHDTHIRDQSLKTRMINQIRLFLIHRIKRVFFVNKQTMCQFDGLIGKYYVGCPIF